MFTGYSRLKLPPDKITQIVNCLIWTVQEMLNICQVLSRGIFLVFSITYTVKLRGFD